MSTESQDKIPVQPVVVQLEITDCSQCPHYGTAADPEPNDWFCDDEQYGFCKITPNDARTPDSNYVSDPMFKTLYKSRRPCEVGKLPVPEWCPMRKKY